MTHESNKRPNERKLFFQIEPIKITIIFVKDLAETPSFLRICSINLEPINLFLSLHASLFLSFLGI